MSNSINGLPEPDARGALRRLLVVLALAFSVLIFSYAVRVTEIDLSVPQEELRQTNLTRAMRELLSPNIFEQARDVVTYEVPFLMGCDTGEMPEQAAPSDGITLLIEPACADSGDVITVQLMNGSPNAEGRVRWLPPIDEDETASEPPREILEIEREAFVMGDDGSFRGTIEVPPIRGTPGEFHQVRVLVAVNAEVRVRSQPSASEETPRDRPREVLETGREDFVLGNDGSFHGTIEVPRIRGSQGQIHQVRVLVAVPSGPITLSDTARQVIERMAQTIFMALVATLVAIPISVLISFLAARNLMHSVRLSVGTMLLTFVMLVVGFGLGSLLLTLLAQTGLAVGKGQFLPPIGGLLAVVIPGAVLAAAVVLIRLIGQANPSKDKRGVEESIAVRVATTTVITLVLIFLTGALAGLCILGGQQVTGFADSLRPASAAGTQSWLANAGADLIWSVGNVLLIIGTLVELFIGGITGLISGFGLAGVAGALFGPALRRMNGPISHGLAAVLGAVSGALVMGAMAALGLWAALLGILPLLMGGILGGMVLQQLVNRLRDRQPVMRRDSTEQALQWLVFAVGFSVVAYFLFVRLSLGRSLVDGTLPPQTALNIVGFGTTVYMFTAVIVGGVLGGISGGLAGLLAAFPLGDLLYNTARTTLNIVRSIEPLIMGLVFVIWVGIGPFAGVLALTLHSIASLGKLYSEQIENIDAGPIEALQSTGANQLQTIVYAVVPQIIPSYIAFTMYRWDINVRMSTIIGFVGGGGIGFLLQQQINLLRYRDAGVAVLAIAVVVSLLDYASAYIREKLT